MEFEPRAVPPSHVLRWFRGGLTLSARKPLWFVLLVALLLPLDHGLFAVVQFLLVPALLACGVALAFAAERDLAVMEVLRANGFPGGWRLLRATLLAAPLVFFIAQLIGWMLRSLAQLDGGGNGAAGPSPLSFDPADTLLIMLFLWFVSVGPVLWFAVALLALEQVTARRAISLAFRAYARNLYMAMLTALLAIVLAMGTLVSISLFPLVAIISCAIYLSYRDVFHGEGLKLETRRGAYVSPTIRSTSQP